MKRSKKTNATDLVRISLGVFMVALIGFFLNLCESRPDRWVYGLLTVIGLLLFLALLCAFFQRWGIKDSAPDDELRSE